MCRIVDEIVDEIVKDIAQRAAQEATRNYNINVAKSLLSDGFPVAMVVKHTGLTEAEVLELAEQSSSA